MEKKYIIISVIIVLIILIAGAAFFATNLKNNDADTTNGTQFQLGPNKFTLPEGFNITNTTNDSVKFSNGYISMGMKYYANKHIKKYVDKYVSEKENESYSVNISNFSVNKHTVYKSELENDSGDVHYWFKKDNSTYVIYTRDANKHTDKIVSQIFRSTN